MTSNLPKQLFTIGLLLVSVVRLPAQETHSSTQGSVSLVKLFPPRYPELAKQTRITGDVLLTLVVRADGDIESVTVVSGHPLLKQAALESAQHSQLACGDCDKKPRSFQMTYSFQLGPTVYCGESSAPQKKIDEQQESYPRVTQSQNYIVVYDRPVGTCDLAGEMKVRSIKCLYLWRCAFTRMLVRLATSAAR